MITVIAMVGYVIFLLAHKRTGDEAAAILAAKAVARGDFQFLALINKDGTKTFPEVPGIPTWVFRDHGREIVEHSTCGTGAGVGTDAEELQRSYVPRVESSGKVSLNRGGHRQGPERLGQSREVQKVRTDSGTVLSVALLPVAAAQGV